MIENGTPKSSKEAPPLRVEAVRKSFGAQKVLNGISLEAAKGETVAVLGKSGTGKSVLLKLMIGLQQPDSGSIRVHGEELRGLRREELNEVRRKMGFLFQNAALYDSLTVEENVVFPLERNSGLPKGNKKKRARELLAAVGMDESLNKLPGEISGGMQKRVGLARALALEPDILLCDEPTAGLDPITAAEIDALILKMQKERRMTSIVVTHDLPSARTISDRLALMRDGQIVVEGTFEELEGSKDKFVREFLNRGS
ncbi:MAG TPA: ABC transporter ATP-binding protein [Candidatus Acidoferrales bacterium]|nr:ABC transporter ATP-binding protein [Candidatus Acidoferrales bacterium]